MRRWVPGRRTLPLIALFLALCLLEPFVEASYQSAGYARRMSGESAAYALAGEFRTVIANVLWIKVEKYHHEYIRANRDWRADADVLPLMKMITDLDPHFVEAYLCGSWMLCTGLNRTHDGLAYLNEGLTNNPSSREINEQFAILYARKLQQPSKALPYLRRAYDLATDPWDRGRLRRLMKSAQRLADEEQAAKTRAAASSSSTTHPRTPRKAPAR